jgi:hypothetical protein
MAKKKAAEEAMIPVGPDLEDEEHEEEEEEQEESSEESEGEEEESPKASKKKKAKEKDEEDDEESGDSDEEDERVGHGEDDEEEEEDGKTNKRESRKARRERQRRARARNELELNFLRQQNEQLEKKVREIGSRVERTELGSIDQRITSIESQMKVAEQVLARAHDSGTGEDVVEAEKIRDKLKETHSKLVNVRQSLSRKSEGESSEPQVDPKLVHHASTWMRQHRWYDPQGSDKDSRVVAAIDNSLVEEGYDPRSAEYWDELSERVRRRLPHRFEDRRRGRDDDDDDSDEDEDRSSKRNGKAGPRFSTGGRERPLRKNEVYVSPERKQAMIDAGVWDDKVLRNKYLKKYAEWDRENKPGRSAR